MKRLLALPLFLFLAGCYSDQKQQVAACRLQANQHARTIQNLEHRDKESSDETELCMRAHGYELDENDCPKNLRTDNVIGADPDAYAAASEAEKTRMNMETGRKIVVIESVQKIHEQCYRPMGWLGQQTLRLEKRFGLAP